MYSLLDNIYDVIYTCRIQVLRLWARRLMRRMINMMQIC